MSTFGQRRKAKKSEEKRSPCQADAATKLRNCQEPFRSSQSQGDQLMAGDWIKLRKCLFSHPKVARIARAAAMSEPQVVGWLAKIWSWADEHTDDGTVANLSLDDIHRLTLAPEKFLAAMRQVGWIVDAKEGVSFPEFDAHMSDNAKKREQKTLQKQVERLKKQLAAAEESVATLSPKCRSNVAPREEKRREEKKLTSSSSPNTAHQQPLEGWDKVAEEVGKIPNLSFDCLTRARDSGCSPDKVLAIIAYWLDHQDHFGIGALYNRIARALPAIPADEGWPSTPPAKPAYVPPSKRRKPKADQIADKRYRLIKAGHNEARDWSDDEIASVDEAALTNQNSG